MAQANVSIEEQGCRRLLDSAVIGLWALDTSGTTTFMNARMRRILGVTEDEASTVALASAVDPSYGHVVSQQLAARRRGEGGTYDLKVRRRDGSIVWLAIDASPMFDDAGQFEGSLALVLDITERISLEAKFRHAQKMEAVGRLAGAVAHDFNNALSIVLTYAEDLLAALDASDPMRSEIEEIQNAALRSAALTRQLLTFSRRQTVEHHVVDLNRIIAGLEKMLRRVIGEDVELVLALEGRAAVRADVGSIEQMLMNLIVNARDAMPRGGRLEIGTRTEDHEVVLWVSDTGIGMDETTRAHVFEPFFTTKERGKGTGLGLATVYAIVQQAGGSITLESEVDRGTTFEIRMPLASDKVSSIRPLERTEQLPRGDETVLLVEDDRAVRDALCGVLHRHGYRVLSAATGEEALMLAQRFHFDLVVSDVVLPHMSGPDLVAQLLQDRPHIGVICMSGYVDDETIPRDILAAGHTFIAKPITPAALTRKVRDVLDAHSGRVVTLGGAAFANR